MDKHTGYLPNSEVTDYFKGSQTIATMLSSVGLLIPPLSGLGQFYKGQRKRAVGITVLQILNTALVFALIGLITYPIVSLWSVYDAYTHYPNSD